MQNLLKNKVFYILLFSFLFIIISLNSTTFASFDFNYNGNSFSLPDLPVNYKNKIILDCPNYSCYYYLCSDYEFTYFLNEQGTHGTFRSESFDLYCLNYNSDHWSTYFTNRQSDGAIDSYRKENIIFSTFDICDSTSGNVVFHVAPQAQGEVVQVELMKPTQVQEIPQQIVAVVMIVLPIFLGIFGVLLVLYLIKSKNLLQL